MNFRRAGIHYVYNNKSQKIYHNIPEKFKHHGPEHIKLIQKEFVKLCVEDGVVKSRDEIMKPPSYMRYG